MARRRKDTEQTWPPAPAGQPRQASWAGPAGATRLVGPVLAGGLTGLLFTPLGYFVMALALPVSVSGHRTLILLGVPVLLGLALGAVVLRHSRAFAFAFAVAVALAAVGCYWFLLAPGSSEG